MHSQEVSVQSERHTVLRAWVSLWVVTRWNWLREDMPIWVGAAAQHTSALVTACYKGDVAEVDRILSEDSNPKLILSTVAALSTSSSSLHSRTPLGAAVHGKRLGVISLLVER
jgi:hypothetical protein